MPLYEHVYIARQDISQQQVEALTDTFKSLISEHGGTVGKVESWGLKTFAYKIKKNRKGHYVLMNIDAPHAAVHEMERQMRIHEDVLRCLTIKVDALEEGPSAMLQSKGRDDRRGGRRGERGDRGDRGGREDRRGRDDRGRPDDAKSSKGES